MGKIYQSYTELIGQTPLLEIKNIEKEKKLEAKVIVKIEAFNPGGSVKDRIALAMIEAAEQKARDASPEPITPDICKHNYDLDKVVKEEFRNMPIGRDFIKVTYYYVCTKCGDTKTEVETYDA